jgi:hypothetical protein
MARRPVTLTAERHPYKERDFLSGSRDTNNKKRLSWAKKYEQWTLDQWKFVFWSGVQIWNVLFQPLCLCETLTEEGLIVMEWNKWNGVKRGFNIFDVFNTVPFIPFQPLQWACPPITSYILLCPPTSSDMFDVFNTVPFIPFQPLQWACPPITSYILLCPPTSFLWHTHGHTAGEQAACLRCERPPWCSVVGMESLSTLPDM